MDSTIIVSTKEGEYVVDTLFTLIPGNPVIGTAMLPPFPLGSKITTITTNLSLSDNNSPNYVITSLPMKKDMVNPKPLDSLPKLEMNIWTQSSEVKAKMAIAIAQLQNIHISHNTLADIYADYRIDSDKAEDKYGLLSRYKEYSSMSGLDLIHD